MMPSSDHLRLKAKPGLNSAEICSLISHEAFHYTSGRLLLPLRSHQRFFFIIRFGKLFYPGFVQRLWPSSFMVWWGAPFRRSAPFLDGIPAKGVLEGGCFGIRGLFGSTCPWRLPCVPPAPTFCEEAVEFVHLGSVFLFFTFCLFLSVQTDLSIGGDLDVCHRVLPNTWSGFRRCLSYELMPSEAPSNGRLRSSCFVCFVM